MSNKGADMRSYEQQQADSVDEFINSIDESGEEITECFECESKEEHLYRVYPVKPNQKDVRSGDSRVYCDMCKDSACDGITENKYDYFVEYIR